MVTADRLSEMAAAADLTNSTDRGILADAFNEAGRHEEAVMLRTLHYRVRLDAGRIVVVLKGYRDPAWSAYWRSGVHLTTVCQVYEDVWNEDTDTSERRTLTLARHMTRDEAVAAGYSA
jgi:hypothetical protein